VAVECFWTVSDNTLRVLLDLPRDLVISRLETTELLRSDGSRRTVHIVHFISERPQWRGEIDLTYHVKPSDNATSLHSIGYSSTNQEGGRDAETEQDDGGARR
jgi:hypothetical protein